MSKTDEGSVVSVTEKGQATIPKELREKHGIDAPGKVRIRETEAGEIVIESVPSLSDMRGAATGERPGTDHLRAGRAKDEERDERLRDAGDE